MPAPLPTEEAVRLLYPADRTAFQFTGPGRPILVPPVTPFVIYADEAALVLADLTATTGGTIPNSTVYTDESGLLPEFLGPYGVTRLWAVAQVDGQSVAPYPLDAAFGPRIDLLAESLTSPGEPGAVNTIRSGDGAPSGALGADGDWYIDKVAKAIYGPKTAGLWGSATSLVGPAGPAGSGGAGGSSYTHYQYLSDATWDITHPLGYVPNVSVVDSAGTHVHGDVRVLSTNRLQVQFSVPFSGTAFLS